ncbi:hypothetical protein ABPG72_006321 [Tetrahymena utriculariae]
MSQQIFLIDNEFFNEGVKDENTLYITIMLNRPQQIDLFQKVRQFTDFLVCADGGANRLYDLGSIRDYYLPRAIVGDLDSIKPNVKKYYEEKGVEISQNNSLDDTDLEKSINFLFAKNFFNGLLQKTKLRLLIIGAFGGRLDQTISNLSNLVKINNLFKEKNPFSQSIIQMMDQYSLATCLLPGEYYYKRSQKLEQTKGLGVLPLGNFNKGKIYSKGLRWNLDGLEFEFGSFISTSNQFDDSYEGLPYIKTDSTIFIMTCINEIA